MVDLRVIVGSTLTSIWESQCMLEVISGVIGAIIVVDMYNKKRWEWYVNVYQMKKRKEKNTKEVERLGSLLCPSTNCIFLPRVTSVCRKWSRIRHQRPRRRI